MDEPSVGPSIDATDRGERLDSWKQIAAHLKRGVTTVQRWEQQEGLPVHRLPHAKKGSVFAIKSELDAWLTARTQLGPMLPNSGTAVPPAHRAESVEHDPRVPLGRRRLLVIFVVVAAAVTALAVTRSFRRTDARSGPAGRSVVPQPLANDAADESCPSLSPDGSHVVYFWRRDDGPGLFIKPVGGGKANRLATGDVGDLADCGYPRWSPAGDSIAFLGRADAETKNVWVVSASGGKARRVTSATGIGLSWTPDGRSLAFVDRNSPGEPFSIYLIDLRGGQRKRLTMPPLGSFGDTYCAVSPNGRKVAIVRYASRHQSDLLVTGVDDAESGKLERLTTGSMGMEGVEWSPDGQFIVFGSNMGLWSVPAVGAHQEPTQFAAFEGGAWFPTFSRANADGAVHRLAYESAIVDVNIWRWDVAKREARRLAPSTWWEDFPAFAPDGGRAAFASNRTGANEIWTVDAEGSDAHQVTFHRGPVVISPQWSPDGERLAFSSQVGGNRDVYVVRPDGSQSTRITTGPSEDGNPSWSRDGRWIYFRSDQAGIGQIWKTQVPGGTPIRVTTGEASQAFESPNGTLLYFVRSANAPGLWSVPVNGGRETLVLPGVREGYWGISDKGIYFLTPVAVGSPESATLSVFDFASGRVSTLASPPTQGRKVLPGFSVSRDGRHVLWTQRDIELHDLMLIAPWRP